MDKSLMSDEWQRHHECLHRSYSLNKYIVVGRPATSTATFAKSSGKHNAVRKDREVLPRLSKRELNGDKVNKLGNKTGRKCHGGDCPDHYCVRRPSTSTCADGTTTKTNDSLIGLDLKHSCNNAQLGELKVRDSLTLIKASSKQRTKHKYKQVTGKDVISSKSTTFGTSSAAVLRSAPKNVRPQTAQTAERAREKRHLFKNVYDFEQVIKLTDTAQLRLNAEHMHIVCKDADRWH